MVSYQERQENYFVLSTGRTGTTFLAHLLRQNSTEIDCFQEPFPGWFFQIMSNCAARHKLSRFQRRFVKEIFLVFRRQRLKKCKTPKIMEINPFLYGLGEVLREALGPFHVLHMVRHPFTFIESSLNFKPGGFKDFFFQGNLWNPEVRVDTGLSKKDWNRMPPVLQKAWLWVFINQKISAYRGLSLSYHLLRFEDLCLASAEARADQLRQISDWLGLLTPLAFPSDTKNLPRNASRKEFRIAAGSPSLKAQIVEICRPLMEQYGYLAAPLPEPPHL